MENTNRIPSEIHFSDRVFVVAADMNSTADPGYPELFERYPLADGTRDISICESCSPTDADKLLEQLRRNQMTYACIGWLPFSPYFVRAAEKTGLSPRAYADRLYRQCEQVNAELGYRAAWIEAYGEIGNSVTWPEKKVFTKREALEYFRAWLRGGRMLTEHWQRLMPEESLNYYRHAKSLNRSLRELPVYYSEGTLFSIQEAYRNGFPLVAYEPQCGTMNHTQVGLAFTRGGAKMHDALWGVDFSPWTGGPLGEMSDVDASGRWRAGVTPDHYLRSWLTAYLMGVNTILHEVSYRFFYAEPAAGKKVLSEYGYQATQFYALTSSSLSDRGTPVASFAVMLEEAHGYRGDQRRTFDENGRLSSSGVSIHRLAEEPDVKPGDRLFIWNGSVPVTDDDWGVHRLVQAIWPLAPGGWADYGAGTWPEQAVPGPGSETEQAVCAGLSVLDEDPRDYHRFLAFNRWSESFDFITETAPAGMLGRYYRVIILAGGIQTTSGNWPKLKTFMDAGGEVIVSPNHLTPEAERDIGPAVAHRKGVKRFAMGKGVLHLLPAPHGMSRDGRAISPEYIALLDELHDKYVGVSHDGPGCQVLVNRRESDTLVTLLNPGRGDWRGVVTVKRADRPEIEAVTDLPAGARFPEKLIDRDAVSVSARVRIPAREARVLSFGRPGPIRADRYREQLRSEEDLRALKRICGSDPLSLLK